MAQPNVVTADHSLGVQTGGPMLVTPEGGQSLHRHPACLQVVD